MKGYQVNIRYVRVAIAIAAISLAGLVGGACAEWDDSHGFGDAPATQVDDEAVPVWPGPDLFMNVGAYCIGANGVYIHTRDASPVVIKDDANCKPDGVLAGVRPADARDIEDAPQVDDGEDTEADS